MTLLIEPRSITRATQAKAQRWYGVAILCLAATIPCFPILGAEKLQNCVKKKIVRIWKTFTKLIKKTSFLLTEVADLHSVISYKTGAKPWQFAFLGKKLFA